MSKVIVCARFRPLSSGEIRDHGNGVSIHRIDDESFNFKDEKDGDLKFGFDKVFYEDSAQASVYEVLAMPIVQGKSFQYSSSCNLKMKLADLERYVEQLADLERYVEQLANLEQL